MAEIVEKLVSKQKLHVLVYSQANGITALAVLIPVCLFFRNIEWVLRLISIGFIDNCV